MCEECYSANARMTPLLNPRECLENHIQYICSTCGRCICIQADAKRGIRRWNFPFKSVEMAKLYLRAAEVCTKSCCGIYKIHNSKGRKSYKIFKDAAELEAYLNKNKDKVCESMLPVYHSEHYRPYSEEQIRHLNDLEVEQYLDEQQRS